MKTKHARHLVVVASLAFVLAAPMTTSALTKDELHMQIEQKKTEIQQKAAEQKTVVKERLDAAKKKACERYAPNIIKMMGNVTDRRQAQIDHITEIANETKAFYVKKGHMLSNYDALVSNVDSKKADADAALAATKSASTFGCDSDGPKAQLQTFRDTRRSMIDAIQAYRQAVKALIQGVKSAQSQEAAS